MTVPVKKSEKPGVPGQTNCRLKVPFSTSRDQMYARRNTTSRTPRQSVKTERVKNRRKKETCTVSGKQTGREQRKVKEIEVRGGEEIVEEKKETRTLKLNAELLERKKKQSNTKMKSVKYESFEQKQNIPMSFYILLVVLNELKNDGGSLL